MPSIERRLPPVTEQVDHLLGLGVHALAGVPADRLRALRGEDGALVVVGPDLVAAADLAPLVRHAGKPGFVVVDLLDLDRFDPIAGLELPSAAAYLLHDVDRGDEMAGWSPDEALPAILAAGRTPLTVHEGLCWLLQQPEALERGHCFMTVGSRLRRADGSLDARTPALWISNGAGRDGPSRRHAPKVGWCWAGNRHTWLGFASASHRTG